MKYLGVDYGSKRLGISVTDAEGKIAFPRTVLDNNSSVLEAIKTIVKEEKIKGVVVGDTRAMNGGANSITAEADAFIEKLASAVDMPVVRAREAFSSSAVAESAPRGEKHNDAAAAAFILQRFLDMGQK